jgi:hypothetical protein
LVGRERAAPAAADDKAEGEADGQPRAVEALAELHDVLADAFNRTARFTGPHVLPSEPTRTALARSRQRRPFPDR